MIHWSGFQDRHFPCLFLFCLVGETFYEISTHKLSERAILSLCDFFELLVQGIRELDLCPNHKEIIHHIDIMSIWLFCGRGKLLLRSFWFFRLGCFQFFCFIECFQDTGADFAPGFGVEEGDGVLGGGVGA